MKSLLQTNICLKRNYFIKNSTKEQKGRPHTTCIYLFYTLLYRYLLCSLWKILFNFLCKQFCYFIISNFLSLITKHVYNNFQISEKFTRYAENSSKKYILAGRFLNLPLFKVRSYIRWYAAIIIQHYFILFMSLVNRFTQLDGATDSKLQRIYLANLLQ